MDPHHHDATLDHVIPDWMGMWLSIFPTVETLARRSRCRLGPRLVLLRQPIALQNGPAEDQSPVSTCMPVETPTINAAGTFFPF